MLSERAVVESLVLSSPLLPPPGLICYLPRVGAATTSSSHILLTRNWRLRLVVKKATDTKVGRGKSVICTSLKNDTPLFTVPTSNNYYYYSPFRINSDQVVVVRVSLHCKGCAGKVKKCISRMQGVTSFNVDFDAKRVTVVGDVTPLEVLASISKVRTAQLLPPEKPNATLTPRHKPLEN